MIVSALGDSLSGGYLIDGRFVDDPNGSYPALVAQQIGATQLGIVALGGAIAESILESIGALPPGTDLLLLNAGTNDMPHIADGARTLDVILRVYDEMLALCRTWMPKARIVVVGIRDVAAMDPARFPNAPWVKLLRHPERVSAASTAFNQHILTLPGITPVALAGRDGADSLEFFPDAIHPSPLGVRWIADAVLEAIGSR